MKKLFLLLFVLLFSFTNSKSQEISVENGKYLIEGAINPIDKSSSYPKGVFEITDNYFVISGAKDKLYMTRFFRSKDQVIPSGLIVTYTCFTKQYEYVKLQIMYQEGTPTSIRFFFQENVIIFVIDDFPVFTI